MKKLYNYFGFLRLALIFSIFSFFAIIVKGQKLIAPLNTDPQYDLKKEKAFKEKHPEQLTNQFRRNVSKGFSKLMGTLDENACFINRDSSYIPVDRNDDESLKIDIPFYFNLYGTFYNTVYINTNGNLTFTGGLRTFEPSGFPISIPMVAAFWADIDTRNSNGGKIYYKIYPTRLIVTWDSVGYYSGNVDKLNTFQIIIGLLGDSLLGTTNNVRFNYRDIQWASSGGFGDTTVAATAGINKGNDTTYFQIGRFSFDNSQYDGPALSFDGINYLDNKCFQFNATTNTNNIPPSVIGLPNSNAVTINVGDTVNLNPTFIGPEVDQSVTTTVNTRNACRVIHTDSNGLVSKINLRFIADTCNVGTNIITFTATDNGTPIQSTIINYTITVNKLDQIITFPLLANLRYGIPPVTLLATASSGIPITYTVTGPATIAGNILTITGVGTVALTAAQAGNNVFNAATSVIRIFCVLPSLPGIITGDTLVCSNNQKTYSVPSVAGATFTWTLSGGGTINYTGPNATVQWTVPGLYSLSVKYVGNCGTSDSTRILTVRVENELTGTITNMLPANGNSNLMIPVQFSWVGIDSALLYDVYIWPASSSKPAVPTAANLSVLNYSISDSTVLQYERLYNWQVVAKRNCYSVLSPVQTFTLRYSPDIVVDSIGTPQTGFAGRKITVSWKIRNAGRRTTTINSWTDKLYISASPVFSPGSALAQYEFIHNGNLLPGGTYTQLQEILLPANITGQYYVHVFTDANRQLNEYNPGGEDNNTRISEPFDAKLKMPADLVVTELTTPLKVSAGQKANIQWTVKNQGDTAVNAPLWNDKIYISTSAVFNANAVLLTNNSHSGGLAGNASYTNTTLVTVPRLAAGNYYLYIFTDAENSAAEFDENNNIRRSDAIVQVGIPDLVVSNITVPATINAGQKLRVNWTVRNNGTGAIETASWTDRIFLSPDEVYTPNNAIWFDVRFAAQNLQPGAVISREIDLTLPDIVGSGRYYAYVYTDFTNAVYEDTSEFNNIARSSAPSNIISGLPVDDIGISEMITPQSDCGLTGNETISVKVSNYGNTSHTGFNVGYQINSSPAVIENIGTATLRPGSSLIYSFAAKANLSGIASYNIKTFTLLPTDTLISNDTLAKLTRHFPALPAPGNLLPADATVDLNRNVSFSWSAVPNATKYDLFIWKSTDTVPSRPFLADYTQINYTYSGNLLVYGSSYRWRVVAKTNKCSTASPVQTFTLKNLPDLVVDSILVPTNGGTSESPFSVSWKTKNAGTGSTGSFLWYETIYLSQSVTSRLNDTLIGTFQNISALSGGQSYTHPLFTFSLPRAYQGRYYLVIKTNAYRGALEEVTDTNNIKLIPIDIALLQPPDLQVTDLVVAPSTLFSEDSISVGWTVRNSGTGSTTSSSWYDYVYLSKSRTLNTASAIRLGSFFRNTALTVNGFYSRAEKFKLPANIGGAYFIHVVTDATDRVFEYTRENNNTATWDNLTVIMRPNPNLTISSVTALNDTVSNKQNISVQWVTKNEGAATANPYWSDNIRLSADTANGYASYFNLSYYNQVNTLQSLSAIGAQQSMEVPYNLAEGKYYFYVVSDIFNSVFEDVHENDNVSPYSNSFYVVNPDLKPASLQAPATASSEETVQLSWTIENIGKGTIHNTSWNDAVYLSTDTLLSGNDIPLALVNSNTLLPSGSQYEKQQTVLLPVGITGTYYFILVTDEGNNLFEKNENNNGLRSVVSVIITPWPDLQVTTIQLPVADTAGTDISFSYTVKNAGRGKINNKLWRDAFYLSPTRNLTDPNRIYLGTSDIQRSLDSGQAYTNSVSLPLYNTISGNYYLMVEADSYNDIFEYTAENNNKTVSNTAVSISQLPNVDLAAFSGRVVADSLSPGQTIAVEWTAGNTGTTTNIITSWADAVYLSNNPTLDATDRLLGTVKINKVLRSGATYYQSASLTLPNDVSGVLYFLLNVDKNNDQNDVNRANNTIVLDIVIKDSGTVIGSGGGVVITPPLPADLTTEINKSPTTGTSGQPFSISWLVKNTGTGITNNGSWRDNIFLSSDFVLDGGDIQIGSFPHIGKLTTLAQYADSQQVFIPSYVAGNYVVIVKTDAYDQVFELNAENNNISFSNILIQSQQPSDLIVSTITPPPGIQIAGQTVTINYTLKNIGTNPAVGYFRDAVYLSTDSVWDVNDQLLGTGEFLSDNILPQNTINRQLSRKLINVAAGNYYVIARTDIQNNLAEANEINNTQSSVSPMQVDVKLLTINITAIDTLVNNELLYYRIIIPAAQKGETMSLTLDGDSINRAVNRLYLRFAESPAANRYDFSSELPFSANQEIIVPELKEGTYYILASGNDTASARQPIELLARIIPFEITKADANKGGNTGAVTIKINGAKFDSTTSFQLKSALYGNITTSRIYYTNSTQVFATFNLLNAELGNYDVVATKLNNDSAKLINGFEIVKGNGSTAGIGGTPGSGTGFVCQVVNIGFESKLETSVYHPASTRPLRYVAITIYYENTGDVDIPVPTRFLVSLKAKVPLGFSPDDLPLATDTTAQITGDLPLEFSEQGGPPGILRPGASGFIKMYTIAYNVTVGSLDFIITE